MLIKFVVEIINEMPKYIEIQDAKEKWDSSNINMFIVSQKILHVNISTY